MRSLPKWAGLAIAAPLLGLAGCRGRSGAVDGPIVLITCDGLRADVVGALGGRERGLTPNLDALIRQASWAGPAIAPSSAGLPAMASLFTGLGPWQHQVLFPEALPLPAVLETLPEALKRRGFRGEGFSGNEAYSQETGFGQGFEILSPLGKGEEAAKRLEKLGGSPSFLWVHLPEPAPPYLRRPKVQARIGTSGLDLPQRILPYQLAPFFDPSNPLPPGLRRRFWALYRFNVAFADERLGRLLEALRRSGQWDRSLVVVASTRGEEFGERGQILSGGNLGRVLIEVPLVVKLPRGFPRAVRVAAGDRPAAARLWATIVEAAGGEAPAAAAPSLFRAAPPGALSELYRLDGTNRFSWVEGDRQLLWESRFAPPEPEYYRALLARLARGGGRAARSALSEPPEAIFDRLAAAFRQVPPLAGVEPPRLTLERWTAQGSEPELDDSQISTMAAQLEAAWKRFQSEASLPERERHEWYTAESH